MNRHKCRWLCLPPILALLGSPCAGQDFERFSEGFGATFESHADWPTRPILDAARTHIRYVIAGYSAVPISDETVVGEMEFSMWRSLMARCCPTGDFETCLSDDIPGDPEFATELVEASRAATPAPDALLVGSAAGLLARLAVRVGASCACARAPDEALTECGG